MLTGVDAPIRYARSGDVSIAYQVTGGGPFDLVLVSGWISHLEADWQHPSHARFLDRLGSFARLIRFDKRGTGMSDRPGGIPDLETRMDDVRAVMQAARSEQAAIFGYSEGGPMSILFAATYPERTRALVLYATFAKRCHPTDEYPWAPTWEQRLAEATQIEQEWGTDDVVGVLAPRADTSLRRWFAHRAMLSASPGAARDLVLMNSNIDTREVLPAIQAPTLVLHRTHDRDAHIDEGRYVASRIPGARFVELPGQDHIPMVDPDQIVDEVEEFLTGTRSTGESDRILGTLLFTDLVGSTERARALGDAAWAALLDRHNAAVRSELARFRGEEIDTAGDGFLALFDGPARAIRCALALSEALSPLGLQVRAGVHTGEVERPGRSKPRGIAVHVGARIASLAGAGEVLVSATTRDLVAGSGLVFEDRGEHELKGLDERRRLFRVAD